MQRIKPVLLKIWQWGKWILLVIVVLGVIYVALNFRYWVGNLYWGHHEAQQVFVDRLTLNDVSGQSAIDTDYGIADPEASSTVEGIDSNKNGIRDDVEMMIFSVFRDDKYARAALLQYAKALQRETGLVFSQEHYTAIQQEEDRATDCVWSVIEKPEIDETKLNGGDKYAWYNKINSHRIEWVHDLIFTTPERISRREAWLTLYSTGYDDINSNRQKCDVTREELSSLPDHLLDTATTTDSK